jgi:hypothetical protein
MIYTTRITRIALFLSSMAFCALFTESLYAAKWQWPPAPTAEVVMNATFGAKPTSEQVSAHLLFSKSPATAHVVEKLGGMDETGMMLGGEPEKDYLYVPGAAGAPGTYQFGWVQREYKELRSALRVEQFSVFLFFQNGTLKFMSHRFDENCLIPIGAESSADQACAQMGRRAVALSSAFDVSGSLPSAARGYSTTTGTVRILPGMTVSEAKKAGKAAGVAILEYYIPEGELLIGGKCDILAGYRIFKPMPAKAFYCARGRSRQEFGANRNFLTNSATPRTDATFPIYFFFLWTSCPRPENVPPIDGIRRRVLDLPLQLFRILRHHYHVAAFPS